MKNTNIVEYYNNIYLLIYLKIKLFLLLILNGLVKYCILYLTIIYEYWVDNLVSLIATNVFLSIKLLT